VRRAGRRGRRPNETSYIDRSLRAVALAVAAHVGGDGVEACRGKRANLMAPGIPGFGKAVAQQHQRPSPCSAILRRCRCSRSCAALVRSCFHLAPGRLRTSAMKDFQSGPPHRGNTSALRERRLSTQPSYFIIAGQVSSLKSEKIARSRGFFGPFLSRLVFAAGLVARLQS